MQVPDLFSAATLEQLLLAAGLLLLLSVIASKASGRLGVPSLLVFLALGMFAGSEGLGGIDFDDARAAQWLGVFALAFILFAGGLETNWKYVRGSARRAISLSTAGVAVTTAVVALFARLFLQFSLAEGFLLGAIVSATDAAAVFSILRASGVRLSERVVSTLELESGSNDPMAVFLTTAAVQLLRHDSRHGAWFLVVEFVREMSFGAAVGLGAGFLAVWFLNRTRLEHGGLYPVLTIATVLLTYGVADLIGGNGFLAVYLAGIVMGNRNFIQRRSLTRFHDGIAWLMQIAMFLTLGLLVFPSHLVPVAGVSLAVAAILTLVARPAAVFVALSASGMTWREKLLIGWIGLRGAVPIVLATFPLLAGVPRAEMIFDIVFFVVLASVALQGTTIPIVARWLGLDASAGADPSPSVPTLAARADST
ncbi:MAG TPA: potassium/proton antiporter, partial [Thermoanaerobaculia bacterium]|nr:potassium/proton antiporter [Thermoanaerobaculia bacterium]